MQCCLVLIFWLVVSVLTLSEILFSKSHPYVPYKRSPIWQLLEKTGQKGDNRSIQSCHFGITAFRETGSYNCFSWSWFRCQCSAKDRLAQCICLFARRWLKKTHHDERVVLCEGNVVLVHPPQESAQFKSQRIFEAGFSCWSIRPSDSGKAYEKSWSKSLTASSIPL